jgi:hypothetical protein
MPSRRRSEPLRAARSRDAVGRRDDRELDRGDRQPVGEPLQQPQALAVDVANVREIERCALDLTDRVEDLTVEELDVRHVDVADDAHADGIVFLGALEPGQRLLHHEPFSVNVTIVPCSSD